VQRIECLFEQLLREAGYVQTYDGQTSLRKATEQFGLQPEERRFFTRQYQKVRNNHFIPEYAKLVYDLRTSWCTECNVYKKASNGVKQAQQVMVSREA